MPGQFLGKIFMFKNRGGTFRGGTYRGGRHSSRSRGGFRRTSSAPMDFNRFINKAEPVTEEQYVAQNSFADFHLEPRLLSNIRAKGYTSPMPIQDQSIKYILEGRDLLGIANTGMGKTAAFLIPLIQKISHEKSAQRVLIITPTRELAEQIQQEFRALAAGMGIYSVLVIGGASINNQIRQLEQGWHLVVGTPGRLCDLLDRRRINLAGVNNLVVDEVDRMFDMGFAKDVSTLLSAIRKERQSLFFTATLQAKEEALIRSNSVEPVKVTVKVRETAAAVDQDVVRVSGTQSKIEVLHEILISEDVTKSLIFARTKRNVEKLSIELQRRGFKADAIHGNKTQFQRQRVLQQFKTDRINILVATDVAARGLDIPNVSHVINYELPENYEDYVHRIGRTGRANKTGKALTFV